MKKKNLVSAISTVTIIALGFLAVTPVSIHAQSADDPIREPEAPADGSGVRRFFEGLLMRTFRYQISMVKYLAASLRLADQAASQAKIRIARLEADGRDVSVLEDALEDYERLMMGARQAQDEANRMVILHDGFEEGGRVADAEGAQATIRAIEPQIKTVRENLVEAYRVIFEAIRDFEKVEDTL